MARHLSDRDHIKLLIRAADPSGHFDAREFVHPMPKLQELGITIEKLGEFGRYPSELMGWSLDLGVCACGNHDRTLHVAYHRGLN